jgi:hypothetical protein
MLRWFQESGTLYWLLENGSPYFKEMAPDIAAERNLSALQYLYERNKSLIHRMCGVV